MQRRTSNIILNTFIFLILPGWVLAQEKVEQWDRFELSYTLNFKGNAFTDVDLRARFTNKDTSFFVDGFYDGNNTFRIRFMPEQTGAWQYVTSSNLNQLNNKKGSFECVPATGANHGIIRVSNQYNFKYADGTQYYPVGTTAYAWNLMGFSLHIVIFIGH